jgi:hypothetical protein
MLLIVAYIPAANRPEIVTSQAVIAGDKWRSRNASIGSVRVVATGKHRQPITFDLAGRLRRESDQFQTEEAALNNSDGCLPPQQRIFLWASAMANCPHANLQGERELSYGVGPPSRSNETNKSLKILTAILALV